MGYIVHYTFEPVKYQAKKSGKCKCGKRVTRSTTFEQTLNPFNKMPSGRVKDRYDIAKELRAEAEAWKQIPVVCTQCEEAQR